MLLFILAWEEMSKFINAFQYISCYCLSICSATSGRSSSHFNTSHVTVYLCTLWFLMIHYLISIHLMLLFIQFVYGITVGTALFQYISCYCLSFTYRKQRLKSWNFNTSHVTVYLDSHNVRWISTRFQYISCYCLSLRGVIHWRITHNFNTSHVTVYLIPI